MNPCPPDVDPMDPVCQGIPDVVMPIDTFVPAAIADDLGVLIEFVDTTVEAGATGLDDIDIDPSVDVAADAIGEYATTVCPSS